MENKLKELLLETETDIDEMTDRVMNFIDTTSRDLKASEQSVVTSGLIVLLLNYLKCRSHDKAEATAHLMGILGSVFLITSMNTSWLDSETSLPTNKEVN